MQCRGDGSDHHAHVEPICKRLERGVVEGEDEVVQGVELFRAMIRMNAVTPLGFTNPRGALDLESPIRMKTSSGQRMAVKRLVVRRTEEARVGANERDDGDSAVGLGINHTRGVDLCEFPRTSASQNCGTRA